ncbi:MAG: tetraacyldisaccharide 4'-kinase [Holosporaceae bacterium]|jgi:tetraacyldisaccharide 4'-kinase|nr:tetraacyldisaccharide 4'-kinase [Holosporaceae bacterium]
MIFFKTPKFWHKNPSILQKIILKPIANIYSYISTKNYRKDYHYKASSIKVIAVGGITVGGSGKTMLVQSICEILKTKNKKVAVLSRGFGRLSKETLLVNNKIHSYKDVGDEPLLLSYSVPVYVGKDRSKSAKLAEQNDFDFLILDDGITQKFLKPDIKLIVIDEEQGCGNGEMFPLGPNRLNFDRIKSDINGIIVLGKCPHRPRFIGNDIHVFLGEIQQNFPQIKEDIVAFCGIGYPDKFFNSLAGLNVVKKITFPDHYPFSEKDLNYLISEAKSKKAQLLTTKKDLMRIPSKYHDVITAISVKIAWKNSIDAIFQLIEKGS